MKDILKSLGLGFATMIGSALMDLGSAMYLPEMGFLIVNVITNVSIMALVGYGVLTVIRKARA